VDLKYLLLYFEENYGLTVEKKIDDAVKVIVNFMPIVTERYTTRLKMMSLLC